MERFQQPLASSRKFFNRLINSFLFGLIAICFALGIGMMGYHFLEKMSWTDAFLNAAMILSGMGPVQTLTSSSGKLFAGFYALFSGLGFIIIVGVMIAPIVHRFFHKMHLYEDEKSS